VVCDLSGNQPLEPLETEGILIEDAEIMMTTEGEKAIKLVAQCRGDLHVVGCISKPKPHLLVADGLDHLKKGTRVRLGGHFSPTNFERHEGTDILKPFGGIMLVNKLSYQKGTDEDQANG
jgi:hypothetical protein